MPSTCDCSPVHWRSLWCLPLPIRSLSIIIHKKQNPINHSSFVPLSMPMLNRICTREVQRRQSGVVGQCVGQCSHIIQRQLCCTHRRLKSAQKDALAANRKRKNHAPAKRSNSLKSATFARSLRSTSLPSAVVAHLNSALPNSKSTDVSGSLQRRAAHFNDTHRS
jgi:hypothetical protein